MKITIISASSRSQSQSLKIANYIQTILNKQLMAASFILDLAQINLPMFDEALWTQRKLWNANWTAISKELTSSNAIVLVTPEWDGMVPPSLKNVFNLCCDGELYHKPALIVAISAGNGGAFPIAELRMSSYKNTRICYIPEQMIITEVNAVFNNFSQISEDREDRLRTRLIYCLNVLHAYAQAFTHISPVLDRKKYLYG